MSSKRSKSLKSDIVPAKRQKAVTFKVYQNHGILEGVKTMYLDEEFADVHFTFDSTVGDAMRIPAHKILLTAASDVF